MPTRSTKSVLINRQRNGDAKTGEYCNIEPRETALRILVKQSAGVQFINTAHEYSLVKAYITRKTHIEL